MLFFFEGWCVHQQVGEECDIVFWESIMNDGGRPDISMLEIHLRNAMRLSSKPLWHTMHAGGCYKDVPLHEFRT